jgi:hypothetical protein
MAGEVGGWECAARTWPFPAQIRDLLTWMRAVAMWNDVAPSRAARPHRGARRRGDPRTLRSEHAHLPEPKPGSPSERPSRHPER